jgi:hypothetical protein
MCLRRHDRHHLGADHQGLPAAGRRHFADAADAGQFGWSFENLFSKAIESHKAGEKLMIPGSLMADPISACPCPSA